MPTFVDTPKRTENAAENVTESATFLEDVEEDAPVTTETELPGLIGVLNERFDRAKLVREAHERRWLRAYRNYRGEYGSDVVFNDEETSRIFVRITKTKVIAVYGQILDALFANNEIPLTIQPTRVPEGAAEFVNVNPQEAAQGAQADTGVGFEGDGQELRPGDTFASVRSRVSELLGGALDKLTGLPVKEGPTHGVPGLVQLSPAELAAKKMHKTVHDQLEEAKFKNTLRRMIFEKVLLGHGVIKGPFTKQKVIYDWVKENEEAVPKPRTKDIPDFDFVSIWNFYPDPDAIDLEGAEWAFERHIMNRAQLRELKDRPFFRKEVINQCLMEEPDYEPLWFEHQLQFDSPSQELTRRRYEVREYWGIMDKNLIEQMDISAEDLKISQDEFDQTLEFQVNIWTCGTKVLRLVLNPFVPVRIPYLSSPYEINPYQFWGVGVPENMEDSQTAMNGSARMAIDNLRYSGNIILEVDETMLVDGQSMRLYPGKIFRRQTGQPGQAINAIEFPNTTNANMIMYDQWRRIADEEVGIPSFSHGQTGVTGTTRTAAGMSMLFGAAALNVKTVVKNLDDYVLQPLGEALFHWNMQFNSKDIEIRGDLEVKASGVSSLLQREVRSQRLITLMQAAANPITAPFVKWNVLIKDIARELELDPDKLVNDPEEAALFAVLIQQQSERLNSAQSQGVTDSTGTGNANVGVGQAARPGEQGFTGTDQSGNTNES